MGAEVGSQGLGMRSPSVAVRERGAGLRRGERSASARARVDALLQTLMARCKRKKKKKEEKTWLWGSQCREVKEKAGGAQCFLLRVCLSASA